MVEQKAQAAGTGLRCASCAAKTGSSDEGKLGFRV